jgi:hypothetical protein
MLDSQMPETQLPETQEESQEVVDLDPVTEKGDMNTPVEPPLTSSGLEKPLAVPIFGSDKPPLEPKKQAT